MVRCLSVTVARPHARRDTSKGPVAVRATYWGCAAFLACFLATEPICVHMVASLELVPPVAGGPWERQAARRLASSDDRHIPLKTLLWRYFVTNGIKPAVTWASALLVI